MVSKTVLDKINQHVFDRHQLAYICVDHSMNILEFSDNVSSYGFDNVEVGGNITDVVDFMVGVNTRENLELPMMTTPVGIPVSVNMLPDDETMTVLMLDASTQMQYRSRLQQAANENELLVDQQKKLMHKLEVASDELQQKNQQLRESNRLQTSFLSGVSHEFRTPLTSIIGYTDLVKQNLVKQNLVKEKTVSKKTANAVLVEQESGIEFNVDANSEYLRAAHRSSKHLLSLVENLLDHGKLNSNEIVVRPQAVDLFEVLDDVAVLLKPMCDAKGIELNFNSKQKSPLTICVDDTRLRQCLINLVGNAIKFTDHGSVNVQSTWKNDILSVRIIDTGLGISEQDLAKIRLPFWQAEGTGKAGTGLGLTITEKIIELMGGALTINSVIGSGTDVAFDMVAPEVEMVEHEYVAPLLKQGLNVLLAEDDADIADLMVMLLSERGIDVTHAKNGAVALQLIEEGEFDLVLMDLNMPVMDGYQAIEKLRERDDQMPVVVMSASALEDQSHPVASIACDAYLVKPVTVDDILKVANQLLD